MNKYFETKLMSIHAFLFNLSVNRTKKRNSIMFKTKQQNPRETQTTKGESFQEPATKMIICGSVNE